MIKHLAITIGAIIALVMMAVTGLYLSWPYWSAQVARQQLSPFGVSLKGIQLSRPTATRLDVSKLQADVSVSSYRLEVQIPTLSIHYDWRALLSGQLKWVQIDQLKLLIHQSPIDAAPVTSLMPLSTLLPGTLLADFPIQRLDIDLASLQSPLLDLTQALEADLHFDGEWLALNLFRADLPTTRLSLQAGRNNTLTAGLSQNNESILALHSEVISVENAAPDHQLNGTLTAHLGRAAALMTQLGLMPQDCSVSGELTVDWALPLPLSLAGNWQQQLEPAGKLMSSGSVCLAPLEKDHTPLQADYHLSGSYQIIAQQLHWKTDFLKATAKTSLPLPFNPEIENNPVTAEMELPAGETIRVYRDGPTLALDNLSAQLTVVQAQSQLEATLGLSDAHIRVPLGGNRSLSADASVSLFAALGKLDSTALQVEQLRLQGSSYLTLDNDQLKATLHAGTSLAAGNIILSDFPIEGFRLKAPLPIDVQWQPGQLLIPRAEFSVTAQPLQIQGQPLSFSRADVKLSQLRFQPADPGFPSVQLSVEVNDLEASIQGYRLVPIEVSAGLNLISDQIHGQFSVAARDRLFTSTGVLRHQLQSGVGSISAHTESKRFSEQRSFLPRLMQPMPAALDFTSGQMLVDSRLSWSYEGLQTSSAELTLQNVSGFYQRNLFKHISARLMAEDLHQQAKITSERVQVAQLNAGAIMDHIQFGLDISPPIIRLSDLEAELFGGFASQNALLYDWSQPENQVVIDLHDLQLKQILNLEAGISGSGSLDGRLPIVVSEAGVRIAQGGLFNRPPGGVIQYKSQIPLGNPSLDAGLKLTLDSLKNFHYDLLKVAVNSDPVGNLLIAASLQGRNPDLKQQRPIHFNLNITENIPALLQSLQLKRDIGDDLERRIESLFNPGQQGLSP